MQITYTGQRRNGTTIKVALSRSGGEIPHRPALREQGTTSWHHDGVEKPLVRRWHGGAGRFRLLIQARPTMTNEERAAWTSPSHLAKSRQLL